MLYRRRRPRPRSFHITNGNGNGGDAKAAERKERKREERNGRGDSHSARFVGWFGGYTGVFDITLLRFDEFRQSSMQKPTHFFETWGGRKASREAGKGESTDLSKPANGQEREERERARRGRRRCVVLPSSVGAMCIQANEGKEGPSVGRSRSVAGISINSSAAIPISIGIGNGGRGAWPPFGRRRRNRFLLSRSPSLARPLSVPLSLDIAS